jgi:hypothetical protein
MNTHSENTGLVSKYMEKELILIPGVHEYRTRVSVFMNTHSERTELVDKKIMEKELILITRVHEYSL